MYKISIANIDDIREISSLASRIYIKYASNLDSDHGKKEILHYISEKQMLKRFSKKGSMMLICKIKKKIAGMIEMIYETHISLFFVDDSFFRKGVATALFEAMKSESKYEHYSVNASNYALSFYKKLGFIKTDKNIKEKDGVHFHPMIY